ncbi:MAG: hypothetical protein KC505_03985 [Myxococcales bacterium]|nr:hypothetical protein [Myxococcales bacterium]USN51522.1 MAG: hypothetical protein H6731_03705 [Myxococcales bacterium]
MDRLDICKLELRCGPDGLSYFPSASRFVIRCRLMQKNNCVALSEWAPLDGIHTHSIEQVSKLLSLVKKSELKKIMELVEEKDLKLLDGIFRDSFCYPVSFILSVLLFDAQIKKNNYFRPKISYSSLILPHHETSHLRSVIVGGNRCLKIKINKNIDEEIERIKSIRKIVGDDIELRIDANKKLNFEEAKKFLHEVERCTIRYIEEPTYEIVRLKELQNKTRVEIALDESFDEKNWEKIFDESQARYAVVKASRFNNIFWLMNFCCELQSKGIKPIFSHCFESPFYSSLMAHVVDALQLQDDAHGIVSDIWVGQ